MTRLRVRAHLCGGALALMPLGLEGAREIVAAPLVSSHAYTLQQHSTLADTLEMRKCGDPRQGGKTAEKPQSCKQRAKHLCMGKGCIRRSTFTGAAQMARTGLHAELQQQLCKWHCEDSMLCRCKEVGTESGLHAGGCAREVGA